MEIVEILHKLCEAEGVSGYESAAGAVFSDLVSPFCGEIEKDDLGNVFATLKCGKENAPKFMIEAHLDKIGLMIKHITDEGFLLFSTIGGFDTKIIPASQVIIYGKEKIRGVIGALPPHIKNSDDKKAPKLEDLCIDTGLSADSIKKIVRVGDIAEFDVPFTPLMGNMVASSALDDRAGLCVLIKCLEFLKDKNLNVDVVAAATVQEEVGMRGAGAAAKKIKPYMAVCVDVCHGKTPDASENVFEMGKGAVITVGPNVQRKMSDGLRRVAKEAEIPVQIDVDSGNTGTNAWVVQVAGEGVYTALISIPLRYMHTRFEVINIDDLEQSARLLATFIMSQISERQDF